MVKNACIRCKKSAKIELKYLGKQVCEHCFCRMTERRIGKNIRQNKLIEKGDKILVGISAGKDSTLMTTYLAGYCKAHRIELIGVYVDREDGFSVDSALASEALAKKLNIPFHRISFKEALGITFEDMNKINATQGTKLCSVCGVMRRYILNKVAKDLKCTKLAIGHNLSEQAQSAMMNFIKGDMKTFVNFGPKSSAKIKGFIPRIKPLSVLPKDEILLYNKIKKLKYYPDPCPCRVGSLRYEIMPLLDKLKESQPGVEFAIVNMADQIAELARTTFKGKLGKNYCKECGEPAAKELCKVCEFLAKK